MILLSKRLIIFKEFITIAYDLDVVHWLNVYNTKNTPENNKLMAEAKYWSSSSGNATFDNLFTAEHFWFGTRPG